MINDIIANLQKGVVLLESISNNEYSNDSLPPYYSSIGCHIRHVLDVFQCVLIGYEYGKVDFTKRQRNLSVEENRKVGISYIRETQDKLRNIKTEMFAKRINLTDNLGSGNKTVETTLEAVLLQVHSHAIHHYATIGYIIHQLQIELPDSEFGYNATTPKKMISS